MFFYHLLINKITLKVARTYSKFLSEVLYFLLFYSLQKVIQIGRKKIWGHRPFKLKILLLNRYVKGTIFNEMIGKVLTYFYRNIKKTFYDTWSKTVK